MTAERGAGAPPFPSGRALSGRTAGAAVPPPLPGMVSKTARWMVPVVAFAVSVVAVPLVAAAAIALHATSWADLVGLGLGAALLTVMLVLVPVQIRLGRLARSETSHWWQEAERSAEREAELSDEREKLLHEALIASDRERRQLAADLHDGVIQLVSAVTLRTATISRGLRREGGQTPERVGAAIEGLERITLDLQAVTTDLRGLMGTLAGDEIESGGLTGALSTLLVPLAESGVQVSISVGELGCDGRVRSLVYRVAQELVRNVAKHADAHQVELALTQERGQICLHVMDDGQGFDVAAVRGREHRGHMGLLLVEQRVQDAGGALDVSSAPGRGTRVAMRLPLED